MAESFLTFDFDDACVSNALERFYYDWQNIPPAKKSRFSAVTALCKDERGRLIGDEFPQPIMDSDSLEMRYKYKTKSEKWGFQRTEVLKQFLFPTPADTLFVVEGMVWSKKALRFKTRFVNEALLPWQNQHGESIDETKQFSEICKGTSTITMASKRFER
jgi:hypothetical protein